MINLSSIKLNKVYPISQIYIKELTNHLIFTGNQIDNDFDIIMNSGLIRQDYIKSFYSPSKIQSNLFSKKVNLFENQSTKYKFIKNRYKNLIYTFKNINLYKNRNLYYDLMEDLDFFNTLTAFSGKKKLEIFINYLNEIINGKDVSTYNTKLLIIPVTSINNMYSIDNNIIKNIYNSLNFKLDLTKLNITFVILSLSKKIFYINNFANLNSNNNEYLKNILKVFSKIESQQKLETEEEKLITTSGLEKTSNSLKTKKDQVLNLIISKNNLGLNIQKDSLNTADYKRLEKIQSFVDVEVTDENKSTEEIYKDLEENDIFQKYVDDIKQEKKLGNKVELDQVKIDKLKLMQQSVELNNVKLNQDLDELTKPTDIIAKDLPINVLFDEVKQSKTKYFDSTYRDKQYNKDELAVLSFLSEDKETPLYIEKIDKYDNSTSFDARDTLEISYKDVKGQNHKVKLDIPKLIDDKFFYLNGSKKNLMRQIFRNPIIKNSSDIVEIATNYNKITIEKFGPRTTQSISKLEKYLKKNPTIGKELFFGDCTKSNLNYKESSPEYDDISNFLYKLETSHYLMLFDRNDLEEIIQEKYPELFKNIKDGYIPFSINLKSNEILLIEQNSGKVYNLSQSNNKISLKETKETLLSTLINILEEEKPGTSKDLFNEKSSKRLAYSRMIVIGRKFPIITVLGLNSGLTSILQKSGIKYEFTEKKKVLSYEENLKYNVIRFADGYLYYEAQPISNSLLLNGLSEISTPEYNFADFNTINPYLDYFEESFGSRNIAKGLYNTINFLLDPITKGILKDLDLPTDFDGIMLYANAMLENNKYRKLNDLANYRIRGLEQVNSLLYKVLADGFRDYKDALKGGKKDSKLNIPQNALIKAVLESTTIDEYSTLNPILEVEKNDSCTFKGPAGINSDDALKKIEYRSYDKSMVSVLSLNTPDSNKVGIVRTLTYNPKLKDTRGFITEDDNNNSTSSSMLSPAELLSPYTASHSDPPRTSMQVQQTKHIIPVEVQNKPLVRSGVEKTLPYIIGNDFIFVAKDDGVVEKIDNVNEFAVLSYKNGKKDVIDLSTVQAKNSNGGLTNRLTLNFFNCWNPLKPSCHNVI